MRWAPIYEVLRMDMSYTPVCKCTPVGDAQPHRRCVTEKMSERMSDHLCYLRDSSIYVHGTVATPPPDLCGTWKVPAWSPDNVSDGRDSNVVSGFRDKMHNHVGDAQPYIRCTPMYEMHAHV